MDVTCLLYILDFFVSVYPAGDGLPIKMSFGVSIIFTLFCFFSNELASLTLGTLKCEVPSLWTHEELVTRCRGELHYMGDLSPIKVNITARPHIRDFTQFKYFFYQLSVFLIFMVQLVWYISREAKGLRMSRVIRDLQPFNLGQENGLIALKTVGERIFQYLETHKEGQLPSLYVRTKLITVAMELAHSIGIAVMVLYDNMGIAAMFSLIGYCSTHSPTRGLAQPQCTLPSNWINITIFLTLWIYHSTALYFAIKNWLKNRRFWRSRQNREQLCRGMVIKSAKNNKKLTEEFMDWMGKDGLFIFLTIDTEEDSRLAKAVVHEVLANYIKVSNSENIGSAVV